MFYWYRTNCEFALGLSCFHAIHMGSIECGMVWLPSCVLANETEVRVQHTGGCSSRRHATLHRNVCTLGNLVRPCNFSPRRLYLHMVVPSLLRHLVWEQGWLQEGRFCDDIKWWPYWRSKSNEADLGLYSRKYHYTLPNVSPRLSTSHLSRTIPTHLNRGLPIRLCLSKGESEPKLCQVSQEGFLPTLHGAFARLHRHDSLGKVQKATRPGQPGVAQWRDGRKG